MPEIAWIIPCFNEAATIGTVVAEVKRHCPQSRVYVFDNASTDGTVSAAREAGADVFIEPRRGKGHVVRTMFESVEADFYILVDGDDTYDISGWKELVAPLLDERVEMTVGTRLEAYAERSFRPLHLTGNRWIAFCLNLFFRTRLTDVLSGYRAFNRRFVKTTAINAKGFEIEAELTLQALENRFLIREVPLPYRSRPMNSFSKLNTFRDGFLVLFTILRLLKDYKPLTVFGLLSLFSGGLAACLFAWTSWRDQALLASFFSIQAFFSGITLNSVSQRAKELSQLARKSAAAEGAPAQRPRERSPSFDETRLTH